MTKVDLFALTPRPEEAATEIPRARAGARGAGADLAARFSDLLDEKIRALDGTQQKSEDLDRKFAAGDPNVQIHDVTIAAAQANLALETAMQFRSLALRTIERLTNLR